MGVIENLADDLARDTIAAAEAQDNEDLITQVAQQLAASSSTMEEAYLTSVRVRLAERRARKYLERQIAAASPATDPAPGA